MNQATIEKVLQRYEKQKEYNRTYYQNKYKDDDDFQQRNRERAERYYNTNKDKKKEYYEKTKERINAISNYKYAVKNNKVDRYKLKYPELYKKYIEPTLGDSL
jgi:hypothetical protein